MAESESDDLNVAKIREAANEVLHLDRRRREVFEREFEAFERNGEHDFPETEEVLQEQREVLASLEGMLRRECEQIDHLEEHSAYLRTEQANRHREQTLEKLTDHNECLEEFCDEMSSAVTVIESNLERFREDGMETSLEDPQEHLEQAREVIDEHNECLDGLGENLRILSTYLQ